MELSKKDLPFTPVTTSTTEDRWPTTDLVQEQVKTTEEAMLLRHMLMVGLDGHLLQNEEVMTKQRILDTLKDTLHSYMALLHCSWYDYEIDLTENEFNEVEVDLWVWLRSSNKWQLLNFNVGVDDDRHTFAQGTRA